METCYEVQLEVAGPLAMFARPDTGSTPISYPVPTWSAAKGMFDAVARFPYSNDSAWIHPTRVEICRPIRYERYVTNYGGPLRNQTQIRNNNNYQLHATVLVDVCYRIYGEVRTKQSTRGRGIERKKRRTGTRDPQRELYDMFTARMAKGQTFYTPCLGWKEFVPTYFGTFRGLDVYGNKIEPVQTGEVHIPAMLISMWKHHQYKPSFSERWIVDGVMFFEHQRPGEEIDHAQ
jgi:CRISPR-associated protein Cas5d